MALHGIKVLEFAGLAPVPMCGMLLSDFGALVTRIDKTPTNQHDVLHYGKRKIALNLKSEKGKTIVRKLCQISDVLIDPFRPGVMEKLGFGPDVLFKDNSKLIYARLTGFGQNGPMSMAAGHDINYVAMSGILSLFGRRSEKPTAPINFAADFAGGGLLCAFGICVALLERVNSHKGQVVDNSMTEGTAYVGSWLMRSQNKYWFGNQRGNNILDSGAHFYDTYETRDGKFMAVGPVEPQFYEILLKGLGLNENTEQYANYDKNKQIFENIFREKTQLEWCRIFDGSDACVTPVLDWQTADEHPHNKFRNSFVDKKKTNGNICPNPAPRLSRTPGISGILKEEKDEYELALEILNEIGMDRRDLKTLYEDGVILLNNGCKL